MLTTLCRRLVPLVSLRPTCMYQAFSSNEKPSCTFSDLCAAFEKISTNRSRKEAIRVISEALYKCAGSLPTLKSALKLCTCTLRPSHGVGRQVMYVADKTLGQVVKDMFKLSDEDWKKGVDEEGDIGNFAAKLAEAHPEVLRAETEPHINCEDLVSLLDTLYDIKGKDSVERKKTALLYILKQTQSPTELKYLIRIVQGRLRIGVSTKTVVAAISSLQGQTSNTELKTIMDLADKEVLGRQVSGQTISFGIPIPPMLGRPAINSDDVKKMLQSFDTKVLCETKYDGERTHLHYSKESLIMFSRNGERQNDKYPSLYTELLEYLKKTGTDSCILDGEIIALDEEGKICSFQEIGKKESETKKSLKVVVFDILWHNNESVTQKPILERKKTLESIFEKEKSEVIEPIKYTVLDMNDENFEEKLKELFNKAKDMNCEGLMIKTASETESAYDTSGSRRQWVKLKQGDGELPADTLDLVPIAAYVGRGKRKERLGSFLMAARDPDNSKYVAICKVGTGMTDEELLETYEKYKDSLSNEKPDSVIVRPRMKPDYWLPPSEVWEIGFQAFTLSPIYDIGREALGNGVSLRFPKLVKKRPDKRLEDATTIAAVVEMYTKMNPNRKTKVIV